MVRRINRRYEFTFNLPQTLAIHGWHVEGIIQHDLRAEIQGLDTVVTSNFPIFDRSSSPALASIGREMIKM
jgi:hypothetical protein